MPIYMIIGYDSYEDSKVNWGYYYSYKEAEQAVLNNVADIFEGCYDYTIIEEIYPGVTSECIEHYFKWSYSDKGYKRIDDPKALVRKNISFM